MAHSYGWIHPETKGRKHAGKRTAPTDPTHTVPAVDLAHALPPIWDQGPAGSCTAQATGTCVSYGCQRSGWLMETPSCLDIYYRARLAIGTQSWDSGAMISDCLEALSTTGWIEERDWPYDLSALAVPCPDALRGPADHRRLIDYEALDWHVESIQWELACGNLVVVGMTVYESFETVGNDGIVPEPGGKVAGGHAMVVVGYDALAKRFRVRNSWGLNWGDWGYCWISESYITDPLEVGELFAVRSVRVRP